MSHSKRIWTTEQVQDMLYKLEAEFGCPPIYEGEVVTVEPKGQKIFVATCIAPDTHAVRIERGILNRV